MAGISVIAVLAAGMAGAGANDSVLKAASEPGQWVVAGHDYGNTRFSPLKQINAENASKLSLAYSFSLASLRSNESSPIVNKGSFEICTKTLSGSPPARFSRTRSARILRSEMVAAT